jgi:glycosyltransferase involved in cell wall biosynthesis
MTRHLDLSVIVPAYREGPRIHDNLKRLLSELDPIGCAYEVIVVSDGNGDETEAEVLRLGSQKVRLLAYATNMGKGYALSLGALRSEGDLVTFIDADMELDPRAISRFIELMKRHDEDIVIGSKRHPRSRVKYPVLRRLQSRCYQALVRLLFDLDVSDTQTGLKLFRRQVLVDALPLLAVKRFAFDLELLVVTQHLGFRRPAEAPIELTFQFQSTVRPQAVFQILWDTAAIFYRLRILKYYNRRRTELAQPPAADANRTKTSQG